MCGIAGILSRNNTALSSRPLDRMLVSQEHRGPDAGYGQCFQRSRSGRFEAGVRCPADSLDSLPYDAPVWLGHRRLSILDLSDSAAQPFRKGELHLVFNGEIFNYIELRKELQSAGESFQTSSDTEVLLAAFRYWGRACVQRLNGIFAFVIFDAVSGSVFAARDQFGVKPLHYSITRDFFVFSSEIKGILASGLVLKKWDADVASAYLGYAMTNAPQGRTFYDNIRQVPPGHQLTIASLESEPVITAYYEPLIEKKVRPFGEIAEEGAHLVREACRIRMRSDRSVGLCLSSGIDSSNVAAGLVREGFAPECYSIAAASSSELDEFPLIDALANRLGLHVNPIGYRASIPTADVLRYILFNDEPTLFWGSYNQFHLYREMRKLGVIVSMSGHGGDELFCGYQRYYPAAFRELLAQRELFRLGWWTLKHSRHLCHDRKAIGNAWHAFSSPRGWMAGYAPDVAALHLRHMVADPAGWIGEFVGASSWSEQQDKSLFSYELQYLLRDADRNSMAHGIEERVPLLDPRLYEFCASIPLVDLCHGGYLKGLARMLFPSIPEELRFHQVKRGLYTDISFKLPQLQADMMPLLQRSPFLRELVDLSKLKDNLPGILWWRLCSMALLDVAETERWTGDSSLHDMDDAEITACLLDSPKRLSSGGIVRHVIREGLSYLDPRALRDLSDSVRLVEDMGIPGCIVETGCALGGSTLVLAKAKAIERPLHVFDVFGLIPPPDEQDGDDARERFSEIAAGKSQGLRGNLYYGYESDLLKKVEGNFEAAGMPLLEHSVSLVPGLYEDTLHPGGPVALAHIDCDWYESVKVCLERIGPHISCGGRMIIDDYDYYSGCRRAVDEFLDASGGRFVPERYARLHLVRTDID